jgi:hypothetical protein
MFGISVKVKLKIISLNGRWFVATGPVSPDPGRDEDPAGRAGEPDVPEGWRELPPSREDWLTEDEWVAWLSRIEPEEWADAGEDPGEEPAGQGASTATGSRAAKNGRPARGSVRAAKGGRRGPGQPGSARRIGGASPGPGGSFATGHPLNLAPGGAALHGLAEYAAGEDDRFPGTTDDELTGLLCALDRAGRLTPGGLSAAITRAVIEVAPDKAAKRREKGTQDARVQRWMEDSGNAALMGRELPPADVLAADQRISWWAKQLKKAGLDGDMDQLRARAYLDILLGRDSRPAEIAGLGPIDPALARDLANAAAASPQTTWCVTVTDEQPPPRFTFTTSGQPGPPGGYGHWRLATGVPGRPDLMITLDPIALDECDHRFQARGHDPGARLRHLSQIRHATCTGPTCRRPSTQADFEHNIPFENGGITCLCNGGPKCRHEHRLKQHPRWNVEQITPGTFRWTAPSGRQYTTEPTRYPILSRVPWGRPFRWISSRTRPERANGHDRGRSTPRYRGASPAVRGQRRAPPPGHGVRRGSDDRTATGRSDAAGWGSAG